MVSTRSSGGTRGRRPARLGVIRSVAIACALALFSFGTIAAISHDPAWAKDYPSWTDVANARKSEAATKAKIAEIQGLIAGLTAAVASTQAESEAKGTIYQEADQKFQEAALKANELQGQADTAAALAKASVDRAGEMIAQLYRSGNGDVTATLFANAAKADDLLNSFGMADKFTEQTASIYQKAIQDQKSAQSLTDQANVAKDIREKYQKEAQAAFEIAQAAANAAADALNAQQTYQNQLQAQLVVLTERREATEVDYLAGRRALIGTGAQLGAGEISDTGWARPSAGRITSGFGYRADPFGGGGVSFHLGTDLGAGCNAPIYAAHSGRVVYAGWNGIYGNFIRIDNLDDIQTEYGHIVNGGILVQVGQDVDVGSQIAKVGMTGGATGCHLHYGVRVHGLVTDPVPFMRGQGITIG
jgi:murein DD-endopeptidase MepM/ murein hydrolase activator NlpD